MKQLKRFLFVLLMLVVMVLLHQAVRTGFWRGDGPDNARDAGADDRWGDTEAAGGAAGGSSATADGGRKGRDPRNGDRRNQRDKGKQANGDRDDLVRISGKVVLDLAPVPGARVFILPFSSAAKPSLNQVMTDQDGRFSFYDMFRGDYLLYAAREPLLSYETRRDITQIYVRDEDREVGPLLLEMRQAQELTLNVVDGQTQEPVVGAHIKTRGQLSLNFTSNQRGIARMPLAPGIWSVEVRAAGYIPGSTALSLAGHQPAVTIPLYPAGILYGVITDNAGKPLPGAEISCLSGNNSFEAQSDGDGRYQIDQLPVGSDFTVSVSAYHHQAQTLHWLSFSPGNTEKEQDFQLIKQADPEDVPYFNVEGVVQDADGHGIGGALVFSGNKGTNSYAQTTTDSNGNYVMAVPVVGNRRMLTAMARGHAPGTQAFSIEEEPAVVHFLLQPGYNLSVQVTDAMDSPLNKVAVEGHALVRSSTSQNMTTITLFDGQKRYTNEQGSLVLDSQPSLVALRFSSWGFVPVSQNFDLEETEQAVIMLPGMGTLRGLVQDERGRPVTDFIIKVDKENQGRGLAVDGLWSRKGIRFWSPEGAFEIDRLPPNEDLKVAVLVDNLPNRSLKLQASSDPNAEPVIITMQDEGSQLGGTLVGHTGTPLSGYKVNLLVYDGSDPLNNRFSWLHYFRGTWRRKTQAVHEAITDAEGRFFFDGLPQDANLDLLIDHRDLALTHKARVQQLPGAPGDLSLIGELQCGLNVTFDAKGSAGPTRVYLTGVGGTNYYRPFSLEAGQVTFYVDRLPPGNYNLEIKAGMEVLHTKDFTLNRSDIFRIVL